MQKIGRFGVLIFLIFMFLFQLTSTGQNKKYFIITGKIVPEVATTESGIIEMSKSGAPITKITIPKNGRFRLELEYFQEYTLTFVLSQHFSKTIIVSTEIPQEVWERDNDFPPFPMVVQLFKEIEGIDKSFTLKASGKIFYGKQTDNFEKESYFSDVQMAEQIETAKAQTSQVAKEAQGITKQEAQDLVVKQKNFDQLIKDADVLYQRGEYQLALIKYLEAKQLFPERAYASDRIAELQDLVKALEITEKQKAELEQKYKAAIARANGFFEQKTYVSARPVYEEALQYKPGDVFANGRIQEIDQLLAMLEKQKQFNDLIAQADNSYKSKNFDQAVTLYNQAKQLVPEKEYPQTQIDLINQEKEQLAKLEQLDKEYQEAIQMADQSLAANDLQQAKLHYQNALKFKASEGYPKEKLAFITESETNETRFIELQANAEKEVLSLNYDESIRLLNDAMKIKPRDASVQKRIEDIQGLKKQQLLAQEKQKEEEERLLALNAANDKTFNDAMVNADKAFGEDDFNTAKSGYEKALSIKAADPVAKQKLGETEAQLAQLAKMTQAYNTAITAANKHVGDKRYQDAKEKYQEALQYLPDSDYPKQQIVKLDELLAQAEAERQKEELYAASIKEGETLFRSKEYSGARVSFVKANELKPSETLPVNRIQEIDKLLAELASIEAKNKATESGYQETIAKADKALAGKEYSSARLFYGEALAIKANEQYPKDKIAEIDQIMADLKVLQYNQAIAAGDLAFKSDQLDEATTQYENALTVKANDQYAKNQLGEIVKRRTALQEEQNRLKKINEQYALKIAAAIADFRNKEYQSAKGKYQEALSLKPEETLPKEQIAKIDALLQELLSAEETNRLYIETVNAGQEAFRQNKLKESRDAFMKARELKPSEPLPPIRIAELNTMIAQMEETARLAALEEAQRLAREKANREQYNKELAIADKAFAEKEYKAARTYYSNALSVLPNEKYPKDQISKIDELIAKQMEISMLGQQKAMRDSLMKVRDEAFNRAIASAKEMEQSKQYQVAIQRYNEAISIKPDERSNVQKMITALEDQLRALDSQNKQYQVSIEKADQLFGASKLEEAIAEYRNASGIKPMEEYPKKQIIDIQNIIKQRNAAYDLAIENGDNAFNKSDLQSSKAAYTEALLVKPNEAYPEKRLREIDQKIIDEKLAGINSSTENAAYNEAVAKAEKALADNELTTAKMHFNVAHSLKPAETMPPQRIKEIDALIEQRNKERLAQAQRDIDERYRQSISVADNAFREKTYTIARLRYQEAQLIKPDETYPKNQIALIDKLLNEAKPVETYAFDLPEIQTAPPVSANVSKPEESAQATEARAQSYRTVDNYDEAIRKADDSFGIKDYTVARFYYYKAIEIKPKEEYPVNQIELIRKLVDSELSSIDRSGYDKAIAQADEAFSKQDYTIAKFYYYKALEIKSWEKYPKDRIAEILALTNSLLSEREEKEYRDMIAKADEAYFTKDIAIARFYYNKAIAMKADENYPRIKLKDIQKLIDQDSRDQKNVEYNKVIEIADQALQAENFSIARFNYNRALNMKPDEKYPKDQLRRIKEALDKQNN